ncbi:MAG TPA: RNA polymerase sigma factor [Microthrixaceae bacterium]|nr:RNA polymerase sigma factor [Microthrixaceae bacterium]
MDDAGIFEELHPALRRFAAVVGGPTVEPDDLVQEALARTLRTTRLTDLDEPGAYLRRVIVHLAANDRRATGRRAVILARFGPAPAVAVDAYASDLADLFLVPPDQRAVLFLHLVEGHDHGEIGRMLDISTEASRARLSRGLKQLRIALVDEGNRP